MDESPPLSPRFMDLDWLRAAYPEWAIGRAADRRDPPRWEAIARHRDVRPMCLITTDLDELAYELASACRCCLVCVRWLDAAEARIGPDGRCPLGHQAWQACGQAHAYSVHEPGLLPKRTPDRASAVAALRRAKSRQAYAIATHRDGAACRAEALAVECDAAGPAPSRSGTRPANQRPAAEMGDSRPMGPGERALRKLRDDRVI